jgi:hypothetical protein
MKILGFFLLLILAACTRRVEWQSTITLGIVAAAPAAPQERDVLLRFLSSAVFHNDLDAENHRLWSATQIEFRTALGSPTIEVRFTATSREASLEAGRMFAEAAIDFAKKKQAPASTATVKLLNAPTIVGER